MHTVQPDDAADPRSVGSVLPVRPPASANQIPSRYRRSTGGSLLAAGLIGLGEVIDPAKVADESAAEQEAPDDAPLGSMEVYLDPDDPTASIVVIRDPADLN